MKPFVFLIAASVKLFSHNLSSSTRFSSSSSFKKLMPVTEVKHWGVVVQFKGDELVYLCELNRDDDGDIIGVCKRMTKRKAESGKSGIYVYDFGKVDTTPEEIKEIAENISINGKTYSAFKRNCQHWAMEFLEALGVDNSQYTFEQIFKNMVPTFILNIFGKNSL